MAAKGKNAIEEPVGLGGYTTYLNELLNDEFFGKKCSKQEAERMFRPTNHGYSLTDLYPEFMSGAESME